MLSLAHYLLRFLWEACVVPSLVCLGLCADYDPTHGRAKVPFSPMEKRLYDDDDIDVWFGKAELVNGRDWCWYQVWQSKSAPQPPTGQRRPDILIAHGTSVHSGTFASHARRFLDAGFRLIVPDLMSHGYSTGIHVYRRHISEYTAGLRAVLHDVAYHDDVCQDFCSSIPISRSQHQPTFLLGISFGGTVALHYALDYPGSNRDGEMVRKGCEIPIDGIDVIGPVLGYSSVNISIPNALPRVVKALDKVGMGTLELFVPHRKCLDNDPAMYKALIDQDPRSHHGAFRVGHLLCIDEAIERLHRHATAFKHPVYIQQGGQDRVACPQRTFEWFQRISTRHKRLGVYPVCQHVVYRKAKNVEEDVTGRVACISDSIEWMQMCIAGPLIIRREPDKLEDSTSENTSSDSEGNDRALSRMLTPRTEVDSCSSSLTACEIGVPDSDKEAPADVAEWLGENRADQCKEKTLAPTSLASRTSRDTESSLALERSTVLSFNRSFPGYQSETITIDPADETYDHPLLAKAHPTTLPLLAVLCRHRRYRSNWTEAKALCPFDVVDVHPT